MRGKAERAVPFLGDNDGALARGDRLRSPPAQNLSPAPVRTATCSESSASKRSNAATRAAAVSRSTALATVGPVNGDDGDGAIGFEVDGHGEPPNWANCRICLATLVGRALRSLCGATAAVGDTRISLVRWRARAPVEDVNLATLSRIRFEAEDESRRTAVLR